MNFKISSGKTTRVITAFGKHPQSENVGVITFSSGDKALVSLNTSKGYVQQVGTDLVPTFCDEAGVVKANFSVQMIDGTPWLRNDSKQTKLTLS